VARLNFSHGSWDEYKKILKIVRKVSVELGEPVAVMQDLQGPKIRVGKIAAKGLNLKTGTEVIFDTKPGKTTAGVIPVDYAELHQCVKPGERFLLDDGRLEGKVVSVRGTKIKVKISFGGLLLSHKGIDVPDSKLKARALTDKDREDARFGVEHGVDFMALSFVTGPDDILDLRYLLKEYEKELGLKVEQPIRIIAKIERQEAVKNIKKILAVADGIMVARGDLGTEIPAQNVPLIQKQLVDEALLLAKPVIVATQMLDSMQTHPRPTRAEVSDVANAVIDHTDAVMLSNETSTGNYPVETVQMMSNIVKEAESSIYDDLEVSKYMNKNKKVDEVVSELSRFLAEAVGARLILAASLSGETAHLISCHRPELPIVVATSTERVRNQLCLSWGVIPFVLVPCRTIEELIERSLVQLKAKKMVKTGDRIIVAAGEPVGQAGHVNLLEVREV
jgi:pyruvate kinase